jgi:alpha-beta hydrolase superfamily lysophospholipase
MNMQHQEGTFQGVRETELFYQSWYPADRPRAVVVGVHGHGDHSGGLRNIVQHLVPKGYVWYGFDLRGHGRSSGLKGHIQSWADYREDLRAFLSMVKEHEPELPVFLVGHSLGGLISLEYSIHHPEGLSGITIICPPLSFSRYSPLMAQVIKALSWIKPDYATKQKSDYTKLTRDAEIIKSLAADPLRHEEMTARLADEIFKMQIWMQDHARDLKVPFLMLQGLADPITPPEGTHQFFYAVPYSNKKYREYEETPHRPFDDINRAEVLEHISGWLDAQIPE